MRKESGETTRGYGDTARKNVHSGHGVNGSGDDNDNEDDIERINYV